MAFLSILLWLPAGFTQVLEPGTGPVQAVNGKAIKVGLWQGQQIEYIDQDIGITLRPGVSMQDIMPLLAQIQSRVTSDLVETIQVMFVEVPPTVDLFQAIATLNASPLVQSASPNFVHRAAREPNDPYFKGTAPATYRHQWALQDTGQSPPGGTPDTDIDAPEAWDISTGSSVTTAILDSGIPMRNGALSHPDLGKNNPNKIILGPDFKDRDGSVRDEHGHGTHVAGIAGAETDNYEGIAGVGWQSKLLIIQVFNAFLVGSDQAFCDGVVYACTTPTVTGPRVINYSGGVLTTTPSDQLLYGVRYADSLNVVIVAAVGNDSTLGVWYPAAYAPTYHNVVAVAATDHHDRWATYSSYSTTRPSVTIAAPGGYGGSARDADDIWSTLPDYTTFQLADTLYGYRAGTSMAAPHVAGTVALMLAVNPNLADSAIVEMLGASADKVGSDGYSQPDNAHPYGTWNAKLGYGRLNAQRAVQYARDNMIHITQNLTWPTTRSVTTSITVDPGKTLTINSGSTIKLAPYRKLRIEGTLQATGTTFQKSSTSRWDRIEVVGTGSGSLTYCNISGASIGISFTSGTGLGTTTLANCTLTDCATGLDLYSKVANVTIKDNTLTGNSSTYYGIFGQYLPSTFKLGPNNTIQSYDEGIDLDKISAPLISGNTIQNNRSQGIACWGGSNPTICKSGSDPSNKLLSNRTNGLTPYTNVYADGSSLPFVGNEATPGNNQITNPYQSNPSLPQKYLIYTEKTSDLYAKSNWWNNPTYPYDPPSSQLYHPSGASHILCSPSLGSAPAKVLAGLPATKLTGEVMVSSSRTLFDTAYQLYLAGQYEQAASLFDQAWPADPQSADGSTALSFLDKSLVEWKGDPTASLDRLTQIATTYAGTTLGGWANQFKTWRLIQANRYPEAITLAEAILKAYPQPEFQTYALHDLGMSYWRGLDDRSRGEATFRTLIARYPDHRLARHALIELGEWTGISSQTLSTNAAAPKNVPQQYALRTNVPNPFNPTTMIRYDLPEAVPVRLVIYNLLGQRVATLVDQVQPPGQYTVVWNGRNERGQPVASGVYIYQLTAGRFSASRKMTLLK